MFTLPQTSLKPLTGAKLKVSEPLPERKVEPTVEMDLSDDESKDPPLYLNPTYTIEARRALLAAASGGSLTALPVGRGARSHEYSLRIVSAGAVTPTAGVAASTFYCDPSNIPLSQWSSFAALFDEVKMTGFTVTIAPYMNPGTSLTTPLISSIAMGSFYSKTSLPTNIIDVLKADDSVLVSPLMTRAYKHKMRVPLLGYASTASPGGTTYYGCPGSVQLYATGTGTQSMLTYFVEGVYHLRGRV